MRHSLLVSFGIAILTAAAAPDSRPPLDTNWHTAAIKSRSDLERIIAALGDPSTRFKSFLALLEFAGHPKGNTQSPDPEVNALHAQAIKAMHACPGIQGVIATMIGQLEDPNARLETLAALI